MQVMRVFRSDHAQSLTESSKFHLIKSEFAFLLFTLDIFKSTLAFSIYVVSNQMAF